MKMGRGGDSGKAPVVGQAIKSGPERGVTSKRLTGEMSEAVMMNKRAGEMAAAKGSRKSRYAVTQAKIAEK
jgi:hypothetical protein